MFLPKEQQKKIKSVSILKFGLDETLTRTEPHMIVGRPFLLKTRYYKKDNMHEIKQVSV